VHIDIQISLLVINKVSFVMISPDTGYQLFHDY